MWVRITNFCYNLKLIKHIERVISMRKVLATNAAKIGRKLSRIRGGSGSTIPGIIAQRIDPDIARHITSGFDEIVFISGTNGKTTTSNIVGHVLKVSGRDIVHNIEGSNMFEGILSSFVIQKNKNTKIAVIEIDEGSIAKTFRHFQPNKMVFTNFSRDQMDRFGELDTLVDRIIETISKYDVDLILNSDDPFVTRLAKAVDTAVYYGINENIYEFSEPNMTESKFCPRCGEPLVYSWIHYSHIGHYSCQCGFGRKDPKYKVTELSSGLSIDLAINGHKLATRVSGDYNVYNILASYALLKELGLTNEEIEDGIESYQLSDGRMQYFNNDSQNVMINLAKNPTSFNMSLTIGHNIVSEEEEAVSYLMALNDNGADGRDVSWIWDVDFEHLNDINIDFILCTGTRAEELALRLKYAGLDEDIISSEQNISRATEQALKQSKHLVAIPNYTALDTMHRSIERYFKEG